MYSGRQTVSATVSVVGAKELNIFDPEKLQGFLTDMCRDIAVDAEGKIREELSSAGFKNSQGNISKSIKTEDIENGAVIYADPDIAPWAVYQERGVHEHKMTYLIDARNQATGDLSSIPLKQSDGTTFFRWPSREKIEAGTAFFHPGYEGKFFFMRGVRKAVENMNEHFDKLIFRITYDNNK